MDQAKAFATEVKRRFGLDGHVFDNAEAAARAHWFPFEQKPPVVHIDRPFWMAWDKDLKIEPKLEKLAVKFGGSYVGT